MKDRIKLKDYIGYGIGILGVIISSVLASINLNLKNENTQLGNNMQNINNEAQVVQQYITNNTYNFPDFVIEAVDNINTASAIRVKAKTFKEIFK